MKILVYPTEQPHALSRRQVEAIFAALPVEFSASIQDFFLITRLRGSEQFEWMSSERRVEFHYVVPEKTAATTEAALVELLVGLGRMQAGSTFWRPLDRSERRDYDSFVARWLPVCRAAVLPQVA